MALRLLVLSATLLSCVRFLLAQDAAQPAEPLPDEKEEVKTYTLSPGKYAQAVEYSRAKYRIHFLAFFYELALLLGILWLAIAPKFRNWAEALSRRRFVQALIFAPALILTLHLLALPLDVYRHHLSLRYDQSVQGWASWLWDWTKGELIALAVATLVAWILYGIIRRSPSRWWFYFWLACLPMIVFVVFISPLWVEPLFYRFEPLEARRGELAAEIEKVTAKGGLPIPRERMFEMKASEKRKSVNAYVSGLGASKRVVVWDTTLEKMTTPQALAVFGHEMGHYVLGHIPRTIAWSALLLLLFLFVGYHGLVSVLRRWGGRWRIRGLTDWASLPVLVLFLRLFSFLSEPLANSYSRWQEHQADIYALEMTHGIVPDSPRAAAEAFQILGEINLADPHPSPFIKFWLYSHPPLAERLAFAQEYDPWSKGESPKFVRRRQ